MMTLYGYWRSTAAYRVRVALNYKQLPFESVSIHLVKNGGEQYSEVYQSMNPQGLVPTLVDQDFTLSQSIAILEYLEEKYPQKPLLPQNIELKAVIRQLCQIIVADIHPINNLRVLSYLSNDLKTSEDEKINWYHHWLKKGFDAYESILNQRNDCDDYSVGGELTIADACLIPQMYNARRFKFCLDDYPRLTQIEKKALSSQCFVSALPENQPDAVIN